MTTLGGYDWDALTTSLAAISAGGPDDDRDEQDGAA